MQQETGQMIIAAEAIKLAKSLPLQIIQHLIRLIADCDLNDWPASKARIVQNISHAHYRILVARFLDDWQALAGEISPQAVSLSLLTAANSEKERRENQSFELVWTGPEVGVIPLRRTEQALLQVISSAVRRIIIVSYAVYNIPRICEALIEAADRGVRISIIIETPDRIEGQNAYNTLKALGPSVAERCNVYFWPLEKREKDANGKPGILHVKCAVADGHWLFLSSANLTEYAFTLNMELGALIAGGAIPEQVENHFYQMIQAGVFAKP